MKRIVWLMCLIIGASRVSAQTVVSFRFSSGAPSSSDIVPGWIAVYGDPSVAVRSATDPTTGISISSVNAANWFPNGDVGAADGIGVSGASYFPWPIMASGWMQQGTVAQSEFNAAVPQLEISGLSPDSVYYIKMSASYLYGTDGDPTQYTVSGLNMLPSQYLTIGGNTTSGITFSHVAPDANGKIRVYVNTTSTTDLALISGVQIISGSATIAMPVVHITSPANNDILAEESNIVINATATETGGSITKVEFFADSVKLGESTTAPYSVTWVNPNEGHYLITAKATDGTGTTNIATIHISVESLSSFWSMTGNIGMNPDSNFVGNVDSVRLAFRTKNLERMSISPLGNVGIGVINPTAQLHTTGTVRLAGIKVDSTNSLSRILVTDTSGNLYYRSTLGGSLSAGDGLGATGTGVALGDSIPGPGPHSFHSNRYQYLNGYMYSIGGSTNDPVTNPAFRIYDNGNLAAGTTMDTSINTSYDNGLRYYSNTGVLAVGASDRFDTSLSHNTAIVVNSGDPNTIKGAFGNSIIVGDDHIIDSGKYLSWSIVAGEGNRVDNVDHALVVGNSNNLWAGYSQGLVVGSANGISKPSSTVDIITGFANVTADTARGSFVVGGSNTFGGLWQTVTGIGMIARTPAGTAMGAYNTDFTGLPYTGLQGMTTPNLSTYPIFVVGNGNGDGYGNATARSNAMTVLYNGRTQINTTGRTTALSQAQVTPQAALDIVSTNTGVLLPRLTTTQRNAIVSGDLRNGLLLYNTDSSAFQYYNGSAWSGMGSGGSGAGAGRWQVASGAIWDSTDNIGIGTSNTQGYKLAVNGNAIFTRVKVKAMSAWPDYVFNKKYRLPDLKDLERYIADHQHLPDLPSAAEVKKEGQDVGETQAVLLKKVEELTLYMIDLNKKVDALEKENQLLKKARVTHSDRKVKSTK